LGLKTGLSQIFGRFTQHRPEEPVLGKPKAQHRLFTAVREIPSLSLLLKFWTDPLKTGQFERTLTLR
jgi:hypothetical protein